MIESLKVKIKSLASEAKHIRMEEVKKKRVMHWEAQKQPSKRHQKDSPRPLDKVYPEPEEGSQERYDEAYMKFWNLQHHRTNLLRKEARLSLLAYSFLRDTPYAEVEQETHNTIHEFEDQHDGFDGKERRIFSKVRAMAKKFHGMEAAGKNLTFDNRWAEWVDAAKEHILKQHPMEKAVN